MTVHLQTALPSLATEIRGLLIAAGRSELAPQVDHLVIVERCRCGDSSCSTFYTAPPPLKAWGPGHENVVLDTIGGDVVLDVVYGKIVCVEILDRDELRKELLAICP